MELRIGARTGVTGVTGDRSSGAEGETCGEAKGSGTGRHGRVGEMLCVEGEVAGEDWCRATAKTRVPGHEKRAGVARGFHKEKCQTSDQPKTAGRRYMLGRWGRSRCDLGNRRHIVRGLRLEIERDIRCGVRNSRRKGIRLRLRVVMALPLNGILEPRSCSSRNVKFSKDIGGKSGGVVVLI